MQKIGDVDLYYELHGAGKETIAFVNGIAMTVESWLPQRRHFSREYRCLLHDTRGQLRSAKPEIDYSMQMHADDMKGLLDHLGLTRVHLVGTSYGSEIAMILAYTYPELVKSLTVITGVSKADALARAGTESWALAAGHDGTSFYRCMLPWAFSSEFIDSNQEALDQREQAMRRLPREYFDAFIRLVKAFTELDITAELGRITCPTLVISAELDIIKPPRLGRIIHEQIPGSEMVVIPGAGHAVVVEKPDLVNDIVHGFIRRLA
jgi:3-oxoadipate enol-lactonase